MRIVLVAALIMMMTISNTVAKDSKEKNPKINIETTKGKIVLQLNSEKAPVTVSNFLEYVKSGHYDGTVFHRVIQNFMIQGGQNADGSLDPGYTVPAEFVEGKYHKYGALAAARKGDQVNPEKASSGSQFYIVQGQVMTYETLENFARRSGISYTDDQIETYTTVGGTPHLDGAYTVFGEVINGFEVIDKIAKVKTDNTNKPIENVTMSIKIID